jgi:hypothetical protein
MLKRTLAAPVLAALLMTAAPAAAQNVWLTPYLGSSLNVDFAGYDPGRAWHYGASITFLNRAGLGFELDLAHAPDFFDPVRGNPFNFDGGGPLTTMMANVMWALPTPGLRPYVSAGIGLMRSNLEAPFGLFSYTDNAVGTNVGGGVRVGGARAALRGDLRYFRQLDDVSPVSLLNIGTFSYWRGSVGLSIGF